MFKKMFVTGALALFTLTSTILTAGAADVPPTTAASAQVVAAPITVTPAEAAGLQFMREEEKLAHDVYVALYEAWGLRVFDNIAASEQQHTDAVAYLLDRYHISDPAAGNELGEFTNVELQALYDQLTAQGSQSVTDAPKVGAAIGEIDILDLQERLAQAGRAAGVVSARIEPQVIVICHRRVALDAQLEKIPFSSRGSPKTSWPASCSCKITCTTALPGKR